MIETLKIESERKIEKLKLGTGNVSYSTPSKIPFFVILHSLSKNEDKSILFSNLLPKNSYVLSIRGPIEWRVDGDDSFAWFDIKGPMIENFCQEGDVVKSIEYIINIVEEFKNKFENLDDPIIIGFSQGGIVGLTMAIEKYYSLKGVYCHCGYYEKKLDKGFSNIETQILMTNGINDFVIPKTWVDMSVDFLKKKCHNFENEFIQCGHEINEEIVKRLQLWITKIL